MASTERYRTPLGGPRFVILHVDNVNLRCNARLIVNTDFGSDVFSASLDHALKVG